MKTSITLCLAALLALAGCAGTVDDGPRTTDSAQRALKADPADETKPEPPVTEPAPPKDETGANDGINECLTKLKQELLARGDIQPGEYEKRAYLECGVDFTAGNEPPPSGEGGPEPSPEYIACANAVKQEALDGKLPLEQYESELAARCGSPVPAAPEKQEQP